MMTPADFLATAQAAGDPTRLQLLCQLGEGPRSVGQLARDVGLTSAAVTYHVRRLREAGLVGVLRRGRNTLVHRDGRRWAALVHALGAPE